MTDSRFDLRCPICGGDPPCLCLEVIPDFQAEMLRVLRENAYKGGRSGPEWQGPFDWLLRDALYHLAKLDLEWTRAERGEPGGDWGRVREHAGDVAVTLLMIWDRARG